MGNFVEGRQREKRERSIEKTWVDFARKGKRKRGEAHSLFSLRYPLNLSNSSLFISLFPHLSKYLLVYSPYVTFTLTPYLQPSYVDLQLSILSQSTLLLLLPSLSSLYVYLSVSNSLLCSLKFSLSFFSLPYSLFVTSFLSFSLPNLPHYSSFFY